jgi:site-specific recombinase XerD
MMLGLLAKYNNHLPYIWEQKLNQYIKVVAEMAGITEEVPITSTKGGKRETANIRKCDLVKTHTARRTGATLMYLSGMDLYDICKITGHTNIKNLRKYIKADELDVATKITKYDYFKN